MKTKVLKTPAKISVKLWRPIIERFDQKMEMACLRRDAYLKKVLEIEIDLLDKEVSIPNSQASYDYVYDQLDKLDRKLVSIALPSELTSRLNEICSRKRIVRDAFFNRIFLLLAASPKVIDGLFFDGVGSSWRNEVWSEDNHNGPFFENVFYPLEQTIDPFWTIRSGLEIYTEKLDFEDHIDPVSGLKIHVKRNLTGDIEPVDSLYTTIFTESIHGNSLIGMNCYMPDCMIPGQEANSKLHELTNTWIAELDKL